MSRNLYCDSMPTCEFLDYTNYKYTCKLAEKELEEKLVELTEWVVPLYDCRHRGVSNEMV